MTAAELLSEILEHIKMIEMGGIVIIILLVILIAVLASKGDSKDFKISKIEQKQKIISELQNITSRQQEFINKIKDTNDYIFQQTQVLKEIQKQTRTESQVEKEEIKKKIEELNKMMKL